jgi:putative membrane protein
MAKDQKESREKRDALAEERTDWALLRTSLAKERTFNAWLRTGLTAMAAGIGVARLLTIEKFPLLTKFIGAILVSAGGILFAISFWRYRHGYEEMREAIGKILTVRLAAVLVLLLLTGTALSLLLIFFP